VSLKDKTYKNAYTYRTHLHMQHNHFKWILLRLWQVYQVAQVVTG